LWLGGWSRVVAVSAQRERHLPFNSRRISQGPCFPELPECQQGQAPACVGGTETLVSPKPRTGSPGVCQGTLPPHPPSAALLGLAAAGLVSVPGASLSQRQNESIKTPGVKPEGKIKREEN